MGNNALKIKVAIGEKLALKHDASKVATVTEIIKVSSPFASAKFKRVMGYRIRYHYGDGKLLEDSQSAFLVRHRRVEECR